MHLTENFFLRVTGKMNKISIALCTYNGGDFLSEQLESYLKQTKLPDELVICDDCSGDKTISVIEDFSKKSPFPVHFYVNEKNLGSTKNFERAISLCSGDLMFLSDQDDVWEPNKIELIYDEFNKSKNIGMVFSDAEVVDEKLETLKSRLWDFSFPAAERESVKNGGLFKLLLKKNVVTGAAMVFRKEFRNFFLPIPTNIPNILHDAWIALIISAISDVSFVNKPLIKYRQHSNQQLGISLENLLRNDKINRQDHYRNTIHILKKELKKLSLLPKVLNNYPLFQNKVLARDINSAINECYEEITEITYHYEARLNLSSSRIRRIFSVYKEVMTGRYHRFSRGLKSAAKDIYESF